MYTMNVIPMLLDFYKPLSIYRLNSCATKELNTVVGETLVNIRDVLIKLFCDSNMLLLPRLCYLMAYH